MNTGVTEIQRFNNNTYIFNVYMLDIYNKM